ncbi:MAG: hypothetical protein ACOCRN_03010 [Spirochaetia bacterium]
MRKNKWLRGLAISAGAFVVVIVVSGLVSCADLFGSNGGGGGGGDSDVDPTGTWLVVLDEPAEGPTEVDFQAALAEIDETEFAIIFYGEDTAQVAGLKGTYEVDGDTVDCLMNIGWFPEDPEGDPDAPELVGEWTATDWYEVVEDDAMALSVTIDGTTLYGGGEGEIEFEKVSFSRPEELCDTWEEGTENELVLEDAGSFTFQFRGEDGLQTGGGTPWEASGVWDDGYLRQVYTEFFVEGEDSNVAYWEFLSPYEMMDEDTMRMFGTFELSEDDMWDYTRAEP